MDPNDPENQNQIAGESAIAGGVSEPAGTSQTNGKPTSSDRFQNLNDYLSANQGSGFAGEFSGKVNNDINQAGSAIDSASQQFKDRSDQGTVQEDSGLLNNALSNPSDFVQNSDNVNKFSKMRDASYSGPSAFSDLGDSYSKAQSATQKSQDVSDAYGSEGGRFALLDNYFGRPDYKQGEKTLDNLLVQNDPQTAQNIQTAKQNTANMQTAFQNAGQNASNYAAGNKGTTEKTRKDTRSALGMDDAGNLADTSPLKTKEKSVDDAVNARTAEINTENNQYSNDLVGKTGTGVTGFKTGPGPMVRPGEAAPAIMPNPEPSNWITKYGLNPDDFKGFDETNYLKQQFPYYNDETYPKVSVNNGSYAPDVPNWQYNPNLNPAFFTPYLQPFRETTAENFMGLDPGQYLTKGDPTQINRNSLTSTQDAATIRALEQLSNQPDNFFKPDAQMGTAIGKGDPAFDAKGFTSAVQGRHDSADIDLKQAIDNWIKGSQGEISQNALGADGSIAQLFNEGNKVRGKYGLGPLTFKQT
jgi:hypothetical protein